MDIWQELEQQYGRTSYTQEQFEKVWELVKYGQHSELSIMRRTTTPEVDPADGGNQGESDRTGLLPGEAVLERCQPSTRIEHDEVEVTGTGLHCRVGS